MKLQKLLETKFFKVLKWTAITVLSAIIFFWLVNSIYLGISLNQTFDTTYEKTVDGKYSIRTNSFYIETPERWIHIAIRPYHFDSYLGYFLTPKGKVHYSYARLSGLFKEEALLPTYASPLSMQGDDYEVKSHQSDKWNYDTVVYPKNEIMGFQIPPQKGLMHIFTIGPSFATFQYRDEIHEAINTLEIFKYVDLQYEQAE